jgi:hypothetical protein
VSLRAAPGSFAAWGTAEVDNVRYGPGMSEEQTEHGELTERFRAFAQSADPEPNRTARNALVVGAVIVVVLALSALMIMLFG